MFDNKCFVLIEFGEIVLEFVLEFFLEILDVEFIVKMENDLDEVEDGNV